MAASQATLPDAQAGERSHGDKHDSASVQVEATQYGEVSESFTIPTKTGEEEAVHETQYDDERPRTAGSAYSAQSDYNNASDGVAGLLITPKPMADEAHAPPAKGATVFVRPTAGLETATPPAFHFGKASRPQLDMVGTRKGPLAAADAPAAKTIEREAGAESQTHGHQATDGPPGLHQQPAAQKDVHRSPEQQQVAPENTNSFAMEETTQQQITPENTNSFAMEATQQTDQPAQPAKKTRKKRKKRFFTAPSEPQEAPAYPTPAEQPLPPQDEMDYQHTHAVQSIELPVEGEQIEVCEPPVETLDDARPATPVEQDGAPADNSPHTQLQHDLQAAASEQGRVVHAHSAAADGRAMVMESGAGDTMQQELSFAKTLNAEEPVAAPTHSGTSARRLHQQQTMPLANRAGRRALGMPRIHAVRGGRIGQDSPGLTHTAAASVRRQGPSRRSTAPAPSEHPPSERPPIQRQPSEHLPSEHPPSDALSSDGIGEMENVLLKVRQKTKTLKHEHGKDRQALQAKVQQITAVKQALQDDLSAVQQQKADLSTLLEQQRGKVTAYETKLIRFKTFVSGLGNDVDALKKEAGITRRKGEQLAQEGDDRKAEQIALFQQLSTCAEKSAQLKDQALRACQEAQGDLQAAHIRNEYLEKQLSERIGLLAEERDRRAQLEKQLVTVASSDESVLRALKQNNDAVLDKLFEMHATLEDDESQKTSAEMVEKTLAAVQGLNTQQSSNADDLVSVRDMVEMLSESLTSLVDSTRSAESVKQSDTAALQATLEEAFKTLKDDLHRREQLLQQDAAHQEDMRGLQNKIETSTARCNDLQAKLHEVEQRESRLKAANSSLQTKIDTVQSNAESSIAPEDRSQAQALELRADLDAKARALESAEAELSAKTDELRRLNDSNTRLEQQSQSLQQRLGELKNKLVDVDVLRKELQDKSDAELKRSRQELKAHSDRNAAEQSMQVENKLRTLTNQKHTLEKKVPQLNEEIATQKAKIHELQKHAADQAQEQDGSLEKMKQQAQAWKHRAENIQSQLDRLQAACKSDEALAREYDAVSAELTKERDQHRRAAEERAGLAKQLESSQQALEAAQSAEADTRAQLEQHETESTAALDETHRQLAEAEEVLKRSEAGVQHLKDSCKNEVSVAKQKAESQIQAMQQRVTQAEHELQAHKDEDLRFRAEVEETWRAENAEHKQKLATAKDEARAAAAKRDEALTETERLRKELESVVARHAEREQSIAAADEQAKVAQAKQGEVLSENERLRKELESVAIKHAEGQTGSQQPSGTGPRIRVPPATNGVTPTTANNKENEAPRQRQKVDRNTHSVVEPGRVPTPDVLRRPESRTKNTNRGPVVEETQLRDITDIVHPIQVARSDKSSTHDDMLDNASQARFPLSSQLIEETQYSNHDHRPSFAAFNSRHTPVLSSSKLSSVPSHVPAPKQSSKSAHPTSNASHFTSSGVPEQTPADDPYSFAVYEDDQTQMTMGTQEARDQLQDSLHWNSQSLTAVEKEKYSFRKTYPNPNSASRMVRPMEERSLQNDRDKRTPEVRGESRGLKSHVAGVSQRHSSTPDFMQGADSARKMSTYYTPGAGGSGKRRLSRNNSQPTADPRLAQRMAPPAPAAAKRKPSITEGYEQERKKRKTAESGNTRRATEPNRYALRGGVQPSIHDLPSLGGSSARFNSSSSQSQSQTQAHMRTLGGRPSRSVRGKKMSKSDEFGARFAQELGR